MRVRQLVQDDAHIFCTEDQMQDEASHLFSLLIDVYTILVLTILSVSLATRPEKRVGTDEIWDKAEHALAEALNAVLV